MVHGLTRINWTGSLEDMQVFGYRSDEVETWYRTSDLCEQAAAQQRRDKEIDHASAGAIRFHQGC